MSVPLYVVCNVSVPLDVVFEEGVSSVPLYVVFKERVPLELFSI